MVPPIVITLWPLFSRAWPPTPETPTPETPGSELAQDEIDRLLSAAA